MFAVTSREAFVLASGRHGAQGIFRTTDSARRFVPVSVPPDRVRSLSFADRRHGYALAGPTWPWRQVWRTADGGRSWRPDDPTASGSVRGVLALAGHGERMFAVVLLRGRCSCRTELLTQRTGAQGWNVVASLPSRDATSGVGLAAWADSVWLTLGVGSSRHAIGLYSTDGGHSFTHLPVPAAVSCGLSATSATTAWVTCSTGMLEAFFRYHQTGLERLPVSGSGTGNTELSALGADEAVFSTQFGRYRGISVTTDGGARFSRRAAFPRLGYRDEAADLSFLTARTGLAVLGDHRLFRTTDGGATWAAVTLPH